MGGAGRENAESVLNVLDRIRETVDASLAYYASCRTGKCGACAVNVNGRPCLACTCLVEGEELDLAPLPSGEFVRDLLTIRRTVQEAPCREEGGS
jgi:Succinate dehydrogenase/fumarate reductase, Fe-S protein subunit